MMNANARMQTAAHEHTTMVRSDRPVTITVGGPETGWTWGRMPRWMVAEGWLRRLSGGELRLLTALCTLDEDGDQRVQADLPDLTMATGLSRAQLYACRKSLAQQANGRFLATDGNAYRLFPDRPLANGRNERVRISGQKSGFPDSSPENRTRSGEYTARAFIPGSRLNTSNDDDRTSPETSGAQERDFVVVVVEMLKASKARFSERDAEALARRPGATPDFVRSAIRTADGLAAKGKLRISPDRPLEAALRGWIATAIRERYALTDQEALQADADRQAAKTRLRDADELRALLAGRLNRSDAELINRAFGGPEGIIDARVLPSHWRSVGSFALRDRVIEAARCRDPGGIEAIASASEKAAWREPKHGV